MKTSTSHTKIIRDIKRVCTAAGLMYHKAGNTLTFYSDWSDAYKLCLLWSIDCSSYTLCYSAKLKGMDNQDLCFGNYQPSKHRNGNIARLSKGLRFVTFKQDLLVTQRPKKANGFVSVKDYVPTEHTVFDYLPDFIGGVLNQKR